MCLCLNVWGWINFHCQLICRLFSWLLISCLVCRMSGNGDKYRSVFSKPIKSQFTVKEEWKKPENIPLLRGISLKIPIPQTDLSIIKVADNRWLVIIAALVENWLLDCQAKMSNICWFLTAGQRSDVKMSLWDICDEHFKHFLTVTDSVLIC